MLIAGRVGQARPRERPLLIYDDRCDFCRRWVARLARWDRRQRIVLVSLWDQEAPALSGRPRAALREAIHVVRSDGAVFAGAAAAREAVGLLPGGAIVRWAARVPGVMPLAERAYRWIARRYGPVS